MVNLDELTELQGAIAALEFTPGGDLLSYKGDLPKDVAVMAAKMCAANSLLVSIQAESLTRYNREEWTPFYGWAFAAGKYSVCVMGQTGVIVGSKDADFNNIFSVLGEVSHVLHKAA